MKDEFKFQMHMNVPVAYIEPAIFETLKAGGSGMFPISNSKFKGPKLTVPLYAEPPVLDTDAIAKLVYQAMGFHPDGKTERPDGKPYSAWETAVKAATLIVAALATEGK